MKAFVVLAALVACTYAEPQYFFNGGYGYGGVIAGPAPAIVSAPAVVSEPTIVSAPAVYSAPIVAPAVTKTQYHAQTELGEASYGYAHPGQAHATVRDAFGNVRGSYAYVNPEGKEIRVEYIADGAGFRVATNALPVAPGVPVAPELIAPAPVQDTPEVAEAKAAHEKAIADAVARNAEADKADAAEAAAEAAAAATVVSRRKRGIYAAPIAFAAPAVHAYHHVAASPYHVIAAPAPVVVAAAHPVREATLTKVVNTPGHAVSYRVD